MIEFLENVFKLEDLQQQRVSIETSIRQLNQPVYTEYMQMPVIYKYIETIIPADRADYYRKQLELITLLLLFAPDAMSDVKRLPYGLRTALSKTTGIVQNRVTRFVQQARFMLRRNDTFRSEVQFLISKVLEHGKEK